MDVLDIINLMANQAGNTDTPTDDEIDIFLKYLNLAYSELLRKTILINPQLSIIEEPLACLEGVIQPLSQPPFLIRHVWNPNSNFVIRAGSIDEVMRYDPNRIYKGDTNPIFWYYFDNQLNTYPLITGVLNVQYITTPDLLALNTLPQNILIPPIFISLLADGACYYIFQEVTGFKNQQKMLQAKLKWDDGIKEVTNYFRSLAGRKYFSTYSRI